MAKPIELKLPARDHKRELVEKLQQAPAEHAAALLDAYDLIQELHEQGIFVIARGLLGAKDKVIEDLSSGASRAESVRAIRNAIILAKTLGSIDPELLEGISQSVGETLGNAKKIPTRPPSLLSLLFGFTSPEHRRGLTLIMRLTKRIGQRLNTNNSEFAEH